MRRISWLREEQKLLGLDCALLRSSELWHHAACCVVTRFGETYPPASLWYKCSKLNMEKIYPFFLVWLLLHTHCRCIGLPLRFHTQWHTRARAHTHTHTHTHTHMHTVRFLWTRDRPVAETSTWQHTTFTRDRHPCPRRNSNPHSQQASGRRPAP